MPVRRRSIRTGVRAQRRKLVWATFNSAGFGPIAAGATQRADLLGDFRVAGGSVLGTTIMRIHASVHLPFGVVADYWYGGIVVGRLSDIPGTAPAVSTDPEIDWMLAQAIYSTATGAAVDVAKNWTIDLRAKRKMQELDQALLFCLTNVTAAAQTPRVFFRTLVALP